ncbi:MAG: hypothetical protein P4L46_00505 [Fimbriimonas sp.]|nr:hypothetical protein [Fimbriimonas sp.]
MKRRAFGAVVLLGGVSIAQGQVLAFDPASGFMRALQERSVVPASTGNPVQPTVAPPQMDPAPQKAPEPEIDDKAFQILHAKHSYQNGDLVAMAGATEFMVRGYHVFAERIEGNLATNIFSLEGDVKVIGKDAVISGDQVTIDFDRRLYHAYVSKQDLKPGILGGSFVADLYAHGLESYGSKSEQETLYGGITSCDLLRPHYEIDADNIIVIPNKKAVFRKARVKLFGRTVLRIPYLEFPLDDRTYNNLPVIGQSPIEGYYIKFRYGVPLQGENRLYTHLDLMSKLGVGIGADYLYRSRVVDGMLQVYTIAGPGEMLKLTDDHRQKFAWGTLSVRADFEQNNYLVNPGSTTESTQALLTFPQHNNAMTKLTLNQTSSLTSGYSTGSQSISVADTRKLTNTITTNVTLDYQNNGSTYQGNTGRISQTNESMNVKFDAQDELSKATADLTYQRQIPIGTTQAVMSSNDATPVATLTSDARRLVGGAFAQNWPFKTSLSIGEFSDQFGGGKITRDMFDLGFQHPDRSSGPFHSEINGEFKQGMYSDGTAEYVLNFGDVESYTLGRATSINLRYNYLRPYGYSPLPIDYTGQTNLATADLSVKPIKSLSIGAQSGYDILRLQQHETAWQPLGARLELQPNDRFLFRAQTTYDTFQEAWSNVRLDLSYKAGATFLSLGSYFDGIAHTWSNVNMFLDGLKIGRTKISALLNYNGYSQRFDSQQYSLTYDLHCAEAVFTVMSQNSGFEPGTTYQFFIRLKAFPFNSGFGAGNRGQPLGTGTGTSF